MNGKYTGRVLGTALLLSVVLNIYLGATTHDSVQILVLFEGELEQKVRYISI